MAVKDTAGRWPDTGWLVVWPLYVGGRQRGLGTWRGLFLPLETEYIRFTPGKVAAVTLTNRPLFFDHFAATIKHEGLENGRCRTTYIYYFRAAPRFLAPVLEPVLNVMLRREVRGRLEALRNYFEDQAIQGDVKPAD